MFAVASRRRFSEQRLLRFEAAMRRFSRFLSLFAFGQSAQHPWTADAHDVAQNAGEFDVDGLQQPPPAGLPCARNSAMRAQSIWSVLCPARARTCAGFTSVRGNR
jgi:hypothetical protein